MKLFENQNLPQQQLPQHFEESKRRIIRMWEKLGKYKRGIIHV